MPGPFPSPTSLSGVGSVACRHGSWIRIAVPALVALGLTGVLLVPSGVPAGRVEVPAPSASSVFGAGHPGSPTPSTDWTTYLGGVDRNGSVAGNSLLSPATAGALQSLWTAQTKGAIVTQPIVVNDTVYIGSEDGFEYAFNATTGGLLWKSYLGNTSSCGFTQGVSSTPTYDHGTLYLGGGDAYWYAVNAQDGKVLWRVFVGNNSGKAGGGNYNWASPLLYNGYAYIGVASHCDLPLVPGGLLQVSLASHRVVARFNTTVNGALGASIWSSPAVDPATNTVYVTTGNGPNGDRYAEAIIALNATTLRVQSYWTVPASLHVVDGDFGTTPTLYVDPHGRALVAATNKDGYLLAFNRHDLGLGPVWKLRISGTSSVSSASFGQGRLFVGGSKTTLAGQKVSGAVRAVGAGNGGVAWAVGFPAPVFAATSYANGLVAAAGGNVFRVLSAQNGSLLFQYTGPGTALRYEFQGAPTIVHNRIYLGDDNGRLYAFALRPAIVVSATPGVGTVPLTVSFAAFVRGGSPPYQYVWNFSDGNRSTSPSPVETFHGTGTYGVTLVVTDASGVTAAANVTVDADAKLGAPQVAANRSAGEAPLAVAFTSVESGGVPGFGYNWSFGDGNGSAIPNPTHVFYRPGVYFVRLAVADSDNELANGTLAITVYGPPPIVTLLASKSVAEAPAALGFVAGLAGGNAPFNETWSFGDGTEGFGNSTMHVYAQPGNFTVTLVVRDASGQNVTASVPEVVLPPLALRSVSAQLAVNSSLDLDFSSNLSGGSGPFVFNWNFGDGNGSNASAPSHAYAQPGNYSVTLTVTDTLGSVGAWQEFVNISGNGTLTVYVPAPSAPPNAAAPDIPGGNVLGSAPRPAVRRIPSTPRSFPAP